MPVAAFCLFHSLPPQHCSGLGFFHLHLLHVPSHSFCSSLSLSTNSSLYPRSHGTIVPSIYVWNTTASCFFFLYIHSHPFFYFLCFAMSHVFPYHDVLPSQPCLFCASTPFSWPCHSDGRCLINAQSFPYQSARCPTVPTGIVIRLLPFRHRARYLSDNTSLPPIFAHELLR